MTAWNITVRIERPLEVVFAAYTLNSVRNSPRSVAQG
jgi:hypothetical protein